MLPIIAIIGRPNVGKSTLFNALTRTKNALVFDQPGVTRDRQYGLGKVGPRPYQVIDTGGWQSAADDSIDALSNQQVEEAINEADYLLFVVDAQEGLTALDEGIAKKLARYRPKMGLVINKADRVETEIAASEFYRLGFQSIFVIAAERNRGVEPMMEKVLALFPEVGEDSEEQAEGLTVAIVGRPNVGKSTLINRMLGEERVIVYDQPGTTRDSIFIPFERHGEKYTLIDTAGIRRRSRIEETLEKFSVIKTLRAIEAAKVVIFLMDGTEGVTDQDLRLMEMVLEMGRGLVIAVNKWDGLEEYQREKIKRQLDRKLTFLDFVRRYFISAQHGTGVGELYRAVKEAYDCAHKEFSTAELTRILEDAVATHQPPLVRGRLVKLRMAHVGGHHPLTIIVHGKQMESLSGSYQRYLMNFFRKACHLVGVPLHMEFKSDKNPYSPSSRKV